MEVRNTTLLEELNRNGHIVYTVKGVSMMPLLRQDRDIVVIKKKSEGFEVGDAVLFRRGERLVLHRIMEIRDGVGADDGRGDGSGDCSGHGAGHGTGRGPDYIIMGDNQYVPELVRSGQMLGVMTSFIRDGVETKVDDPEYQKYVKRIMEMSATERRIRVRAKAYWNAGCRRIKKLIGR